MTKPTKVAPSKGEPLSEEEILEKNDRNFNYLAKEFTRSYFRASVLDMKQTLEVEEADWDAKQLELKRAAIDLDSLNSINPDPDILFEERNPIEESNRMNRNILVIGAGCSKNAFHSVLTGDEARSFIYNQFKTSILDGVPFEDFLREYGKANTTFGDIFADEDHTNGDDFAPQTELQKFVNKNLKKENEANEKQEDRLIMHLAEKYFEEYQRLNLYNREVPKKEKIDFESSLSLLAKFVPIKEIRNTIRVLYSKKHGGILFYEIIAHLFKHRFIDVIINFNFDEFLDNVLEDELSPDTYDKVLSDGDCETLDKLIQNGRLRQPLYIKPHGTVSHKSTLRFTKDHYFEIPLDLRSFLENIISCKDPEGKDLQSYEKRVNLITVGFNMRSQEFNEILSNSLPAHSNFFYFYHLREEDSLTDKYNDLRSKDLEPLLRTFRESPNLFLISHQLVATELDTKVFEENENSWIELRDGVCTLSKTFREFYLRISSFYDKSFCPSDISRHELITVFFGINRFLLGDNTDPSYTRDNNRKFNYPDYFYSIDYLKDRVVFELFIHLTFNRARIDPPFLLRGRTGKYYSLYFEKDARKKSEPDGNESVMSLAELVNALNKEEFNSLQINHLKYPGANDLTATFEAFYKVAISEERLFSPRMKKFIKSWGENKVEKDYVFSLFQKLAYGNRSVIQSNIKAREHHAFRNYHTTDLINTNLSLDLYFHDQLKNDQTKHVFIVADYGGQITKFLPKIFENSVEMNFFLILVDNREDLAKVSEKKRPLLYKSIVQRSLEAMCHGAKAFTPEKIDSEINVESLSKVFNILYLPINRHNHHMTIFMNDNNESKRVIYYYQQGLSRGISPMRIREKDNINYMKTKFADYAVNALDYCGLSRGDEIYKIWQERLNYDPRFQN